MQLRERDRWVIRLATPGDIMKSRDYISLFVEKLEEMGITSDKSESTVVYVELGNLRQLVECLDDPGSPVYLLAVLRGMLFGIRDTSSITKRRKSGVSHGIGAWSGAGIERLGATMSQYE